MTRTNPPSVSRRRAAVAAGCSAAGSFCPSALPAAGLLLLAGCAGGIDVTVEVDRQPDLVLERVRILPITYRELAPCARWPSLTAAEDELVTSLFEAEAGRRYHNDSEHAVIIEALAARLEPDAPEPGRIRVHWEGEFTLAVGTRTRPVRFVPLARYTVHAQGDAAAPAGAAFEKTAVFDALMWDLTKAALRALVEALPGAERAAPVAGLPADDPRAPPSADERLQPDRSDQPRTRSNY